FVLVQLLGPRPGTLLAGSPVVRQLRGLIRERHPFSGQLQPSQLAISRSRAICHFSAEFRLTQIFRGFAHRLETLKEAPRSGANARANVRFRTVAQNSSSVHNALQE